MSLNNVTIITTAADHGLSPGEEVFYGREVYYARVLDARRLVLYADTGLTTVVSDPGTAEYIIGRDQYPVITIFPRSQFTDDGRGILGAFIFDPVITSNVLYYDIKTAALAAGWDGNSILYATVTIAPGVYVYSDSTALPALTTGTGYPDNSRVEIINNGYIIGKGGSGGSPEAYPKPVGGARVVFWRFGLPGGPAMNIGYPVTITNNSYIAGGGGGGCHAGILSQAGGGGGAGGGQGGWGISSPGWQQGGAGGEPGQVGGLGFGGFSFGSAGGGGGGRILPGVGGTQGPSGRGGGGGAGGSGGGDGTFGDGGSANQPGIQSTGSRAGGGGGWGASGGTAVLSVDGGAGGKAINLNGNAVTFAATGTVWGAIS